MEFSLTKTQQQIVEKARWVAMECLDPRAAEYDRSANHPLESWNDLWEHGLLAISVPRAYGGLGLDMLTYIMVIDTLAYGCTNSTMTFHMHCVVQRVIDALATPDQKQRFYREVVEDGKVFGSWGGEPESRGGSEALRKTVIFPVDGGYAINGRKHFCSMAGAAHRSMVHCSMRGYAGREGFVLALVPHDAPGMEITGGWDTLGCAQQLAWASHLRTAP